MESINRNLEVSRLIREIVSNVKHHMGKGFEKAGLPGITPTQGMIIGMLGRNGKMKVSEISRAMGLSNSTVSGMIDRLERQKMVERLRSEEDKRVVFITLSPELRGKKAHIRSKVENIIDGIITEKGSPEDYEKIIEGLRVLKRLLTDSDGR